jgi:hypothetical protein
MQFEINNYINKSIPERKKKLQFNKTMKIISKDSRENKVH